VHAARPSFHGLTNQTVKQSSLDNYLAEICVPGSMKLPWLT
jgi:hypothetical protein